jgi:uncharacterized SAM-binding protein YcdF (DUF218 family)
MPGFTTAEGASLSTGPGAAAGPAPSYGAPDPIASAGSAAPGPAPGASGSVVPHRAPVLAALPGAPPAAAALRKPPARPQLRRRLGLALLAGLPLALFAGFVAFAWAAIDPAPSQPGETDGIVVLTGGTERVGTGFRLLAEGQARRLLISGAHPEANLAEIAAAAGIDPAPFAGRVDIGHAAASTRGNAAEAAAWARANDMRSLRIVTAGYHMPRAMLEMRRALPQTRLVDHRVPSAALRAPGAIWRPQLWALLAGEYARYVGAWAGLSGAFVPRREAHAT